MISKKRLLEESDLYVILDRDLTGGRDILKIARCVLSAGVSILQLRDKHSSTQEMIRTAKALKALTGRFGAAFIIDDRIDVALAVKADGIHVGQNDMPYEYFRKIIPARMIRGLSVETPEQAAEAEDYKLAYISVSPVFLTATKSELEHEWGLEGLRSLAAKTRHTLVAIGGINKSNAGEVLKAGAKGIAVVSAICSAPDPLTAASELKSIIEKQKIIL